jgi:hypothetical protein
MKQQLIAMDAVPGGSNNSKNEDARSAISAR